MSLSPTTSIARRLAVAAALFAGALGLLWTSAQPAAARTDSLDLRVSVEQAPGSGAKLSYRGTFTGAPMGRGKVDLVTRLGGSGNATVTYTMTTSRGTFSGAADVTLAYHGSTVAYNGRATITRGTGAYRRLRASNLRISGQAGLTSDRTTLSLTGPISS